MLMTWKFRPGNFASTAMAISETQTDSAMVRIGIRASSGER